MLAHYFFGGLHYSWLAVEYFPYKLANPKSSNPHFIYQDLYQPWRDRDDLDKTIAQSRLNLAAAVLSQEKAGKINQGLGVRLRDICDKIDIVFFYPVVYRVDIEQIPTHRISLAASGMLGSQEFLIRDLSEPEFDILFLDFRADLDFTRLVYDEVLGISRTSRTDALNLLEIRC